MRLGTVEKIGSGQGAFGSDDAILFDGTEYAPRGAYNRIQTGGFTRVASDANNAVDYTGLGFRPTAIDFRAVLYGTQYCSIITMVQTVGTYGLYRSQATPAWYPRSGSYYAVQIDTGANWNFGYCGLIDDGFRLTWTKGGTPTGNINVGWTAYR